MIVIDILRWLKVSQNRKAVSPDKIHSEMLQLIAERDGEGIEILTSLFNAVYQSGEISIDWLRSNFIPIPINRAHPAVTNGGLLV